MADTTARIIITAEDQGASAVSSRIADQVDADNQRAAEGSRLYSQELANQARSVESQVEAMTRRNELEREAAMAIAHARRDMGVQAGGGRATDAEQKFGDATRKADRVFEQNREMIELLRDRESGRKETETWPGQIPLIGGRKEAEGMDLGRFALADNAPIPVIDERQIDLQIALLERLGAGIGGQQGMAGGVVGPGVGGSGQAPPDDGGRTGGAGGGMGFGGLSGARAFNVAAGAAASGGGVYFLPALMTMMGAVGIGAGLLTRSAIEQGQELEKARSTVAGVMGIDPTGGIRRDRYLDPATATAIGVGLGAAGGAMGGGLVGTAVGAGTGGALFGLINEGLRNVSGGPFGEFDADRLGVKASDFLSQYVTPFAQARGFGENVAGGALMMRRAELLGLDRGAVTDMAQLERSNVQQMGMEVQLDRAIGRFGEAGLLGEGGKDLRLLPELLNINNQLARDQLMATMEFDSELNQNIISEFGKMGFTNPQLLGTVMTQVNQSLRQPANDYVKAFQFSILRELNPNATRFELIEDMQKGLGVPGRFQTTLQRLQDRSRGNEGRFMEEIMNVFGTTAGGARIIGKAFAGGRVGKDTGIEEIIAEGDKQEAAGFTTARAEFVASFLDVSKTMASTSNTFADAGAKLINAIDRLIDVIKPSSGPGGKSPRNRLYPNDQDSDPYN